MKRAEKIKRKNVSLAPHIIRRGERLAEQCGKTFSGFLTDLIIQEDERPRLKQRSQSFVAHRRPFEERVAETVETLMGDFKGYTANCRQDNPKTGGKSAMFESWALQRLASLIVRGLEIEERIARLER